jgi:hypothetical protein
MSDASRAVGVLSGEQRHSKRVVVCLYELMATSDAFVTQCSQSSL